MTTTSIISLIISIVGAILGASSFYLVQLRKANVVSVAEQRIRIGYTDGGGFQFYIPITFINKTHQTGIVFKMNLLVYLTNEPERIYSIDLSRFSEMNNEEKRIIDKELPHALGINGKASLSKLLRFTWWNSSEPKFDIKTGKYKLILNIWTKDRHKPDTKVVHYFNIDDNIADILNKNRDADAGALIEIPLNNTGTNNRVLTSSEKDRLY